VAPRLYGEASRGSESTKSKKTEKVSDLMQRTMRQRLAPPFQYREVSVGVNSVRRRGAPSGAKTGERTAILQMKLQEGFDSHGRRIHEL